MIRKKYLDSLVLIVLLILAPLISFIFKTNLLISIALFYGLPALWLSFKLPEYIKRTALFSLLGTVLFFMIDYVVVLDGGWFVPTIFDFRLLGVLPIEDSIWFFMGVYVVVMFYEYFDDKGPHKLKKTKLK